MLGRLVGSWEAAKVRLDSRVRAQYASRRRVMLTQLRSQWRDGGYREICRVLYRERGPARTLRPYEHVRGQLGCQKIFLAMPETVLRKNSNTAHEQKEQANETAYCL